MQGMKYEILRVKIVSKPVPFTVRVESDNEGDALNNLENLVKDAAHEGRGFPIGGPFVFGSYICQAIKS